MKKKPNIIKLILAVESIHKLDCIYRDIKTDNFLIDKNGLLKLSDFGLAKIFDKLYENNKTEKFNKNKLIYQKNFSLAKAVYYAIFKIFNQKRYGKEFEWWSIGVNFFWNVNYRF